MVTNTSLKETTMRSAVLALAMVVAVNGFGDKVAERVARNILQRDDNSHVEMGQPKKHAKAKEGRQGKLPGDKCSRQCLAHSCEVFILYFFHILFFKR